MNKKYLTIVLFVFALVLVSAAGCSKQDSQKVEIKMAALSEMPQAVRQAPTSVQLAYQFNIANPDIMEQIPCYCGCGAVGHHSNFNCYAKINADGSISMDGHALGCSICVDISLDTKRLMEQGMDVPEIQAYVDDKYSRYGPPTTP